MRIDRRTLLRTGLAAGAAATAGRFRVSAASSGGGAVDTALASRLDRFTEQYMRDMHAPGMTLVLAGRSGVRRVAAYGFGDVERRIGLQADQLFQIGSISKSFLALCLLQLRDEGRLDLHRPVREYLPWLPVESAFAPLTSHHLLTHSSGLPSDAPVFLPDPAARHRTAYAPGEHFHYSNLAFELLGHLAWTLDGRELPELLRQRVLLPLGMTQTEPAITLDMRERLARSYGMFLNDREGSPGRRLCEAPGIIHTEGAGCIASTARDMGAYIRMLANGGEGPGARLLSKESFALFSQPHIEAAEFGPGAAYGYGIAVDRQDGHAILRHTGGMVSFASSLMVDLDAGVGAFASINAMQDYRPNPVARFALDLMRAREAGKPLPEVPASNPPSRIGNAGDFAQVFKDDAGRTLVIERQGDALFLVQGGERIPLEQGSDADQLLAVHGDPALTRFPLVFQRSDPENEASPVTEVLWGSAWYASAAYDGPWAFAHPPEWDAYVGHYRSEDPWIGSARVVICKGQLWVNGAVPLQAQGGRFYLRDEPHSPEWISFGEVINGRCMRIKYSGADLWRVATA